MKLSHFVIFIMLLVFLVAPIMADEGTEEAPSQEVVITPAADSSQAVNVNLVQVIIGLLTAFAAGGIVGIAGLSVFVQRLQKDTATVTALELLANSLPPKTLELLFELSRGTKQLGALGEEVFDNKPVAEKLPQLE